MKRETWFYLIFALASTLFIAGILVQLAALSPAAPAPAAPEVTSLGDTPIYIQALVGLIVFLFGLVSFTPFFSKPPVLKRGKRSPARARPALLNTLSRLAQRDL